MPDAVIFDLDGLLLESEQVWNASKHRLTEDAGGRWRPEAEHDMLGMSSTEWSRYMHEELALPLAPGKINDEVVKLMIESYERELPLLPGADEAVRRIDGRWPLGLASSSNREIIDTVLGRMGWDELFAVTVSSEEVERGKPQPDVYLEAARRLGAEPGRCVAVEDSSAGIRSALAAGMGVVAVPNREYRPDAGGPRERERGTRLPARPRRASDRERRLDVNGKVALVTGASGGIGASVARKLHDAGASVGLLSRRGEDLGLERGLGVACDVRDRAAVEAATAAVVERFGRLDVAVANAGVGAYGDFLELDPEQLEAMIDVNLKGVLYTAAATLPHLIESGEGDFVSLASVAGVRAFPGEAVYNASKFGQVGFTRALDHELREKGVRATSICPGGVHTEFAIGTGREHGDPELDEMLTPDEVADVVLFTVTRPRTMRILTTTFRPMSEGSFG